MPIASVIVIYAARIIELNAKRETIPGRISENVTLRLFVLTGTLVFAGSIVEALVVPRPFSWGLFAVGWLMAIGSFVLRRKAIAALGKFWSLHVEIREEHQFICSGPFRVIRHPTYLSMILELLALTFICNAWIPLLMIPLLFIPALLMRVRIEEDALVNKFGDTYREYQRTTPALFPIRWLTHHS